MADDAVSKGGKWHYPPDDENDLEQCVWCGVTFGSEDRGAISYEINVTSGPVVQPESGRQFDIVLDTTPGSELVHPDCYAEIETERRRDENESLTGWVH
jgi:hypothetical protein